MAHADHKKFGGHVQGKGDGTGAMSEVEPEDIEQNQILSNRDKSQDTRDRGQDGRNNQTEQIEDHVGNRIPEDDK
ncbi:hypothetical protein [Falsirhodobacter sp. 1013]|uniref:hypothetical protein n=1 Tax=Falsirhodobacter sp. 1013 TaxID=3417566 RepID=UPI003EBDE91F